MAPLGVTEFQSQPDPIASVILVAAVAASYMFQSQPDPIASAFSVYRSSGSSGFNPNLIQLRDLGIVFGGLGAIAFQSQPDPIASWKG